MAKSIVCGVYRIDGPNGKFYIGSSARGISRRLIEHRRDLRKGDHANKKLQAAWNKHGEEAFRYSVVEVVHDPARVIEREQHWINLTNAYEDGYNLTPTAGSLLGVKHSEGTRKKMSEAQVGKKHGPMAQWQKDYYSALYKGRGPSPEAIEKSANSRRGMKFSEERCRRISEALKGKSVSAETREKIRQAGLGKKQSPETIAKRRDALAKTLLSRGVRLIKLTDTPSAAYIHTEQTEPGSTST